MKEITNPGTIELSGVQKIILSTKGGDPVKHIRDIEAMGFVVPSGFFLLVPPDIDISKPWDYVVFWDCAKGQLYYVPKEAFLYVVPKWIEEVVFGSGEPVHVRSDHRGQALEKLTVTFRGPVIRLLEKIDAVVEDAAERLLSSARQRLVSGQISQLASFGIERDLAAKYQAAHEQMFMEILGSGVVIDGEAAEATPVVKILPGE